FIQSEINEKNDIMSELKKYFRPELLNRLDEIIVFHKLNEEQIAKIAKNMLNVFVNRVKSIGVELTYTDSVADKIAKIGFDPVFGARPLRRAITSYIEYKL
ncbi:MAG: ATP-dependent Clp protease ATP-binding subunit ClpC, partial [Oscillospiraceae bacterium]